MKTRIFNALTALMATFVAYALIWGIAMAGLQVFGAPVGVRKMEAFGIVVIPMILLMLAWMQRGFVRYVQVAACVCIWFLVWRHSATYDAANAVGTLWKEESWTAFSTAFGAYLNCAIVGGIANAVTLFKSQNIVVTFPFKGEILRWPD